MWFVGFRLEFVPPALLASSLHASSAQLSNPLLYKDTIQLFWRLNCALTYRDVQGSTSCNIKMHRNQFQLGTQRCIHIWVLKWTSKYDPEDHLRRQTCIQMQWTADLIKPGTYTKIILKHEYWENRCSDLLPLSSKRIAHSGCAIAL